MNQKIIDALHEIQEAEAARKVSKQKWLDARKAKERANDAESEAFNELGKADYRCKQADSKLKALLEEER